jgi:hypothetical protein
MDDLAAAGAISALLLFFGRRIIPQAVRFPLALIATAAVLVTEPAAVVFGIIVLFEPLGIGWIAVRFGVVLSPLLSPGEHVFGGYVGAPAVLWFDLAYWRLIQLLAICAVVPRAGRLPLPNAVARLRSRLERQWPDGRRALFSTVVAAAWFGAVPVLGRPSVGVPIILVAVGVSAVIALRLVRPQVVSWGAWVMAMTSVTGAWLPWRVLDLAIAPAWLVMLLPIFTSLLAAMLVLAGPRRDPPVSLWFAPLYAILVVLPGLGWLV